MKVSLRTVKQFTDVTLPLDELVVKINAQLGGVEEIIDVHEIYKDALIVRVVECSKHANADKLSVCMIDAGQKEFIQVVCGAPNVHSDMWAIWLPPKSTVPASYNDKQPFVLDAREIRGQMSHGMLAAADELGIGSDHSGIIELSDNDLHPNSKIKKLKAGLSFAQAFGLDDTVIDIENKMFTHRPDLFGQLGVAREIAGIQHKPFVSPSWYEKSETVDKPSRSAELPLTVTNDARRVVPRFTTVTVSNVKVGPSPMWLQCSLIAMGGKPINNIVDVTNYIMLITAQPTHAYDYDKLAGAQLGARMATQGEKVTLLNGKTYECTIDDIVIADASGPVGLAGIMGGGTSEVSKATKNIVLEVANFDMYAVRKTSMRHGLFTDALTRFNKGQSPLQNEIVLTRLLKMILDICGGSVASEVSDLHEELNHGLKIDISVDFINDRLGSTLDANHTKKLLKNVEFDVKDISANELVCHIPFWRTDIVLPEDIVEEVGRLYGFDSLPHELPSRSVTPVRKNNLRETKNKIRTSMKQLGANEVMTYSFVHENVIRRSEQDLAQAFRLSNALSPDLQYYRLSVLPSLLDKVHMNIKSGHNEFVIYEIGKGHNKAFHATDDEGLPSELQFVDAVYASKTSRGPAAYFVMKNYLSLIAKDFGVELVYKPITEPLDFAVTAPFDQSRSALVETKEGLFIGMVGEIKATVAKNFKLPLYVAAMTLDLSSFSKLYRDANSTYVALSRFPSVTQDVSLKVPLATSYTAVVECVTSAVNKTKPAETTYSLVPVSIYQPADGISHKTVTLRLKIASYERTLTDKDVNRIMDYVAKEAQAALKAERV